jgi:hypothetical protein
MTPLALRRGVRQFDAQDKFVIELTSGGTIIVWDQDLLVVHDEWCSYAEEGGVSHHFDASTVAQVMGYESLPDLSDPPYPFRNGRPKPPA